MQGFGTIEPENGISQVSPPLEIFEWFDGYRRQKVRRHFLDFSSEAIVSLWKRIETSSNFRKQWDPISGVLTFKE